MAPLLGHRAQLSLTAVPGGHCGRARARPNLRPPHCCRKAPAGMPRDGVVNAALGALRLFSPAMSTPRVLLLPLLALALWACSQTPQFIARDEPWRADEERACLSSGVVQREPLRGAALDLGWARACAERSGLLASPPPPTAGCSCAPALLRCPMVPAVDHWVERVVMPAARRHLRGQVVELKVAASYSCRPMNNVDGALLSEHGHANAIDVSAFVLADGRKVEVKTGWWGAFAERNFLRDVHRGACDVFTHRAGPQLRWSTTATTSTSTSPATAATAPAASANSQICQCPAGTRIPASFLSFWLDRPSWPILATNRCHAANSRPGQLGSKACRKRHEFGTATSATPARAIALLALASFVSAANLRVCDAAAAADRRRARRHGRDGGGDGDGFRGRLRRFQMVVGPLGDARGKLRMVIAGLALGRRRHHHLAPPCRPWLPLVLLRFLGGRRRRRRHPAGDRLDRRRRALRAPAGRAGALHLGADPRHRVRPGGGRRSWAS